MKNKKIKIFAKILFSLFVIAVMTAAVGIAILVGEGYYIYDRVTAQRGIEDIVQQIQDAEDYVPYEEISPYMKDAIVAIEDHRFYSHAGIDPYATAKMAIINMAKSSAAEVRLRSSWRGIFILHRKKRCPARLPRPLSLLNWKNAIPKKKS